MKNVTGMDASPVMTTATGIVSGTQAGDPGAVVVWTGGGNTSVPLGVGAGAPTSIYLPFASFPGPVDWSDVEHIGVGIQTGGFMAAHDYVLKSIKAVSAP